MPEKIDVGGKAQVAQKKVNPHCRVAGCRVSQPHTDDPLIKALVLRYTSPDKLLGWVQVSLGQIHDSILDDYNNGRHFGWITRLRHIEELYFRTLYITFLIPDEEVPHWLSGDPPNSLTKIYETVNQKILMSRGKLIAPQTGRGVGQFTPMSLLHSGGHANYKAMQHVVAFELAQVVPNIEPYLAHVKTYIDRIDHMRKLFEAGRDKHTVQQCIINMHTPIEEWQKRAQQAASSSSS
jgi:hypothetical protein